MNKIALSVVAIVGMSSFGFAGGDIAPVPVILDEVDNSAFYVGAGLAAVSTRDAATSLDFFSVEDGQDRLGNFSFLAGYDFNEFIAVEARYTTSFSQEDRVQMDGWSLFVKPQYPVSEDFSIYALLGFGGVTMDGVNGYGVDVSDNGFQWGLGMSYEVMENVSIFADYTSLASNMDGYYWNGAFEVDADAVTIGMTYKF